MKRINKILVHYFCKLSERSTFPRCNLLRRQVFAYLGTVATADIKLGCGKARRAVLASTKHIRECRQVCDANYLFQSEQQFPRVSAEMVRARIGVYYIYVRRSCVRSLEAAPGLSVE